MFKFMYYVSLRDDTFYFSGVKEKSGGVDEKLVKRSKGIFLWFIIIVLFYFRRDSIVFFKILVIR